MYKNKNKLFGPNLRLWLGFDLAVWLGYKTDFKTIFIFK